jgi:hypothetical protein
MRKNETETAAQHNFQTKQFVVPVKKKQIFYLSQDIHMIHYSEYDQNLLYAHLFVKKH